ncbi:unnamed protein product [Phaedon cochleariae]|uniref:Uncharacterized protein n=1 Tax=Phaedon cochleariae TaxID=80249 RepID=A0A9N9SI16_PHACE|nr:unnamed protein product [Phaedon cochleariae]
MALSPSAVQLQDWRMMSLSRQARGQALMDNTITKMNRSGIDEPGEPVEIAKVEPSERARIVPSKGVDDLNKQPTPLRRRHARSADNIDAVRQSVQETPRQSISRRVQELGLPQTSTWRILRRDLDLYPYKIQLTQQLKVNDHRQRRLFAHWASKRLEEYSDFGQRIIPFLDEWFC